MLYENGYYTQSGNQCFNSCLANYFKYNNIEIYEYDIFFIGKGYSALAQIDNKDYIIGINIAKSTEIFLNECNILYTCEKIATRSKAKEVLKDCVIHNKLLSLNVLSNRLSYNDIFINAGDMGHIINIIGYDPLCEKVYVSDCYVPTTKEGVIFEGWLNLEDIMDAWELTGFEYYVFDLLASYVNIDEIKNKCNDNIKNFFDEYFIDYTFKRTLWQELWDKLLKQVDTIIYDISQNEDISRIMYAINYNLKVNGFLMLRYYILDVLKYNYFNIDLAEKFYFIIEKWKYICIAFVKISFTKSVVKYETLKKQIRDVLEQERKMLLYMCEIYNIL